MPINAYNKTMILNQRPHLLKGNKGLDFFNSFSFLLIFIFLFKFLFTCLTPFRGWGNGAVYGASISLIKLWYSGKNGRLLCPPPSILISVIFLGLSACNFSLWLIGISQSLVPWMMYVWQFTLGSHLSVRIWKRNTSCIGRKGKNLSVAFIKLK